MKSDGLEYRKPCVLMVSVEDDDPVFARLEEIFVVSAEIYFNPFTGVGAILRPVRVVCSKNHKKSPERAMFFLNIPADAEKISLPRGIFRHSHEVDQSN